MYQYFIPLLWLNNLITSYNFQVHFSFICHSGQISNPLKTEFGSVLPTQYSWHLGMTLKASSSLTQSDCRAHHSLHPSTNQPFAEKVTYLVTTTALGFPAPLPMPLLPLPLETLFIFQNLASPSPPWRSLLRFISSPNKN